MTAGFLVGVSTSPVIVQDFPLSVIQGLKQRLLKLAKTQLELSCKKAMKDYGFPIENIMNIWKKERRKLGKTIIY